MSTSVSRSLRRTYDELASIPNLAADAAFVDALPKLNSAQRTLALEKLLERGHLSGLRALVGNFASYDGPLRDLIVERVDRLFEATRLSVASNSEHVRLGAVELIRAARNCGMSYLLSESLTRRCTRTTNIATTALLELTRDVLRRRELAPTGAARRALRVDTQHLADALLVALDSWRTHHRTDVLTAAMLLSDVIEDELLERASRIRLHLAQAMDAVLRSESDPALAAYALRALRHPDLCATAARKIATTPEPAFVERLLDEVWITADRANAKACSRIRSLCWIEDGAPLLHTLRRKHALAAVELVGLSGIASEAKARFFSQMIECPSPSLREAGAWRIASLATPGATHILRDAVASDDPIVSQIAVQELFRRDPHAPVDRTRSACRQSPENVARSIEIDFDAYWDRFDDLDETQRRRAGRKLRGNDPERFARRLRGELASGSANRRLRALGVVRTLDLAQAFEENIYAISHDPDERLRSLAMTILADLEGATAYRILRQALHDPDHRVQANAVEVLGSINLERCQKELARKLDADSPRVRANAVHALLRDRTREGAVALLAMLEDDAAAHRMSALWVVEQLRLASVQPRLERMVERDPDENVRERARRILDDPNWVTEPDVALPTDRAIDLENQP